MVIFDKLLGGLRTKRQGKMVFPELREFARGILIRLRFIQQAALGGTETHNDTNDMRAAARGRFTMASVPFDQLDGSSG
jgi:hypothetical protein